MSQSSQSTFQPSQTQAPTELIPAEARQPNPFAKFDNRIAGVSDRILPKQPYLITIPSDFPYRRHNIEPNRWFLNTPFSRREEQLQYMSLLLHQDDEEALLRVDGTRIDEDGRLLAHAPSPRSELPSRPETPSEAGPKKKISLKDYKTKDRSGVNTPERRPQDDIRKQAIKSHKEEVEVKKEEQSSTLKPVVKPEQKAPSTKPSIPSVKLEAKPNLATPTRRDEESQRPAKKRRLSTEAKPSETTRKPPVKTKEETHEKRALPALLSPEMPTPERKQKARDLPALLSPKLPQALEKATASPPQRSDEVRAILSAITSPVRAVDKKGTDGTSKDTATGRVRSESQTSAQSVAPGIKISSPVSKPLTPLNRPSTPLANGRTISPRPRQKHVIVLKYTKKIKKRMEMLERLSKITKQKREASLAAEKERPIPSKTVPKPEVVKPDNKRPAESSPEVPAKRVKTTGASLEPPTKSDRPSTPKPEAADKSPSNPTKHKSAFSTPKKELKSMVMQRVASTDTTEAHTPQDAGRLSTPPAVSHPSQPKSSPAPTATPARSDESTAWTDLGARIFQLGRNLKKEGQKLAGEGHGKERQQGTVLLIEALLCFMLNSAALAQARHNGDAQWSTILPYYSMVYRQSRQYKQLHGLVVQLGAVWRQHLHQEHIRRLSRETLPDDHIGSVPTPGSDGSSKNVDDYVKKQKSFLELRDELVSNSRDLRIAWLEGSKLLPIEVIERDYPSTWKKRIQDLSKRNPDRLNPRELPKDFPLPIDVTTNVFEATNFALMFLWEWTMIEQVNWKTRIEL